MYNELLVLYNELEDAIQRAKLITEEADRRHALLAERYGDHSQPVETALATRGRCATIIKDLEAAQNRTRIQMGILVQENYRRMRARTGSAEFAEVGLD